MLRLPPRSTRNDTLVPYTTLFRSRVTAIDDRNTLRDCLIPLLVPERFLAGPSVNGDDLTLRPLSNLLFVLLRQHQVIPASMTKWFKSQLTLGHYLIGKDRAVVMEMLVDRIIRWLTHRSEEHTSDPVTNAHLV